MAGHGFADRLADFCDRLRTRRVDSSLGAAKGTAELLRQLVASSRRADPRALLEDIRAAGVAIQLAKPTELAIGNVVRRVLHIVREEMGEEEEGEALDRGAGAAEAAAAAAPAAAAAGAGGLSRALKPFGARAASLHNLLDQVPPETPAAPAAATPALPAAPPLPPRSPGRAGPRGTPPRSSPLAAHRALASAAGGAAQLSSSPGRRRSSNRPSGAPAPWDRKQEAIDGVNELIEELRDVDAAVALRAPAHIHANELILTLGFSRTVLAFLSKAAEKRRFQVVVAEGFPTLQGHAMAQGLAEAGITTTLVADAAVYALMARVNKVVASAHALLADGGVVAPVGAAAVAAAARRHAVPFVALAGIYKLSPIFPHEPGAAFADARSPEDLLPYGDEALLAAEAAAAAEARAAAEAPLAAAAAAPAGAPAAACSASTAAAHGGARAGAATLLPAPLSPRSAVARRPFLLVRNPSFDYVPPAHVSLLVTDHGPGFMPSYVYRMLSEFYHRDDYSLSKELDDAALGV
jgi:translation initiation factor eIF-2B subunit beta